MKEITIKIKEDYMPTFLSILETIPQDKIEIKKSSKESIDEIMALLKDKEIYAVFERLKDK